MKAFRVLLVLLLGVTAYLLFWPTRLEPQSWTPPVSPGYTGAFAANDRLKGIEKLAVGVGNGPESVVVDKDGNVYTGYVDGRVMQFSGDGKTSKQLTDTGGRPLGVALGPDGSLLVADAFKGLLKIGANTEVLSTAAGGQMFGFTDDVDMLPGDPWVYFSDASWKYGFGHHMEDVLEHGDNGRLLRYNLQTHVTEVLMKGLHFANGVALGPNGDYVLVNVTGEYRVLRYWIKGDKAGTSDVFIDNLPGFPDNITFNGRDRFWLALFAPRDPLLDQLLPGGPFVRKIVGRLPAFLQPKPKMHAMALGLGLDGKVAANLQYEGDDAFAPITSVREAGDYLYFGSLTYPGFGRIALKDALAGN